MRSLPVIKGSQYDSLPAALEKHDPAPPVLQEELVLSSRSIHLLTSCRLELRVYSIFSPRYLCVDLHCCPSCNSHTYPMSQVLGRSPRGEKFPSRADPFLYRNVMLFAPNNYFQTPSPPAQEIILTRTTFPSEALFDIVRYYNHAQA